MRITTWIRRFITNSWISKQSCINRLYSCLKVHELIDSAHVWCRYAESLFFVREIRSITNENEMHINSKIPCLNPYIDISGLLRVGPRLMWAPINNKYINSILLRASHIVTQLLFEHFHKINYIGSITLSIIDKNENITGYLMVQFGHVYSTQMCYVFSC